MKLKGYIQVTNSVGTYATGVTSARVSYIEMPDYLIAIDTGMSKNIIPRFRNFVEKQTGKKFEKVILTHFHGDHTFNTRQYPNCDIISSENTLINLKVRIEESEMYQKRSIVLPNITFKGEYTISNNGKTVQIIQTKGHTSGSSFVFFPDENVLLTGDLIFSQMGFFGGDPTADPYEWILALQKMRQLNPAHVIPGHGPLSNVKEIKIIEEYMVNLVDSIKSAIKSEISLETLKSSKDLPTYPYKVYLSYIEKTVERFYEFVSTKMEK